MALIHGPFFSQVLGLMSTMRVLLPNLLPAETGGTPPSRRQRYPVLYLLHGMSDEHTVWQRQTSIERYVTRRNVAVVMPAVQRSLYTDTQTGQRYWRCISAEVPAAARAYFPLSERREETYVAGLSMGGMGCSNWP